MLLISRLLLYFLFLLLPYNALATDTTTTTTPEAVNCSIYIHDYRYVGIGIGPYTFVPEYPCFEGATHCVRIDCERNNNFTHDFRDCFRIDSWDSFEPKRKEDKYCESDEQVVLSSFRLCQREINGKPCNHPDNDDYVSTASTADVSTADTTTTTVDLTATTTKPKLICSVQLAAHQKINNDPCYSGATHCFSIGCEKNNNVSFIYRSCYQMGYYDFRPISHKNKDQFCGTEYDSIVLSSLKFCQGKIGGLPCNHPDNDDKKIKCAKMKWHELTRDELDEHKVVECPYGCIKVMCFASSEPYATRYGIWRDCYRDKTTTDKLAEHCRNPTSLNGLNGNNSAFYPETHGVYYCNKSMCNDVDPRETITTRPPRIWTTTTVTTTTTTVTTDKQVAEDSQGHTAINGWVKGTSQPFNLKNIKEACGSPVERKHLSPEFSMKICVRKGFNCSQGLLLCYVSRLSNDHSWDLKLRENLNLEDRTDQFAPAMVDVVREENEGYCNHVAMPSGWRGARLNALNLIAINNTLEIQTSISQSGNERKVVMEEMKTNDNSRCAAIGFGLQSGEDKMNQMLDEIINGLPLADLAPLDILRFDVTMGLPYEAPVFVVSQGAHDHVQAWQCQMRITFEEGHCPGGLCLHKSNNPDWKVVQPKIDKGNQTKEQVKE